MIEGNRRNFLKTVGGVTLGVTAVSGLAGLKAFSQTKTESLVFPFPYKKLEAVPAAERAYQAYYEGGCMYGAFEGIIGELREAVGGPFNAFPSAMMKYGAAGVSGWGTLCGALNGAAAAIFLVHEGKIGNPIINELYAWYGVEALPDYKPRTPKFDRIVSSVADSQLCHISVTKWCDKSGFKSGSKERAERCAWITASVAKYTVELLNRQAAGGFAVAHAIPAAVKECISCHGKDGTVANVHATAHTSCTSCHSDVLKNHPTPLKK